MGGSKLSTIEQTAIQTHEIQESLKIGILGGTFNPPHYGHLIIAEQVKSVLQLDKILFLPTAQPPHAHSKFTIDSTHRTNMLQMAIQNNSDFFVSLIEVNRGGKNYTIDTIRTLQEMYPTVEFYFILGADMVEDLENWHRVDELLQLIPFVSVKRLGYSIDTKYSLITVDIPQIEISSSQIRQFVKSGLSIRYLVPEDVRFYIEQEGLYQQ